MVPSTFTSDEIEIVRQYIIGHIHANSRYKNGTKLGKPYVTYGDMVFQVGHSIESPGDSSRAGYLAASASKAEFHNHSVIIGAVVVNKETNCPGSGFWVFAEEMGLFFCNGTVNLLGKSEWDFWDNHVKDIVKFYGRK